MSYNVLRIMGRLNPIPLRLMPDELERLNELVKYKKRRYHSVDRSKIIRELMGLDPPTFLTPEDKRRFIAGLRFDSPIYDESESGYLASFGTSQMEKGYTEEAKRVIQKTIANTTQVHPPDLKDFETREKRKVPTLRGKKKKTA